MAPPALRIALELPRRAFSLAVELEVGAETVALVGPSGAGKSSLLRAVAGLERGARGRIALDGEPWLDSDAGVRRPPELRSVGLVFQDHALFPHLSVRENVAFGGRARVEELLARMRIEHLAGARPAGLSGGERQRVALARALARGPRVLLLDEPMAALDAHTRGVVRGELRDVLGGLGLSTIVVSHDFEDAAALADRVAVMEAGRIVQLDTPAELVARPASEFVASLVGANLLEGVAEAEADGLTAVRLTTGGAVLRSPDRLAGRVGLVVQPADVTVAREVHAESSLNHVRGTVRSIVVLGNRARVRVGPLTAEVTARSVERLGLAEGQEAVASFKAVATRLVPLGGGARDDDTPP